MYDRATPSQNPSGRIAGSSWVAGWSVIAIV
jgi:hypothetical protein